MLLEITNAEHCLVLHIYNTDMRKGDTLIIYQERLSELDAQVVFGGIPLFRVRCLPEISQFVTWKFGPLNNFF